MDFQALHTTFATNYDFVDAGLPREEQLRLRVMRFFSHIRHVMANEPHAEQEKAQNQVFLMERLYQKLPDANEDILIRLTAPLLPELEDWMKNKRIPINDIGVRVKIGLDNIIGVALCNHAGPDGCDCGDHPKL